MKRPLTIPIIAVAAALFITSCSGSGQTDTTTMTEALQTPDISADTADGMTGASDAVGPTETETTIETTATPSPSPTPTLTPSPALSLTPTPTPSPTPTPTPKPKKGVKISAAVDQTFNLNGVSYIYRIPKVTIGSKNMDKVNKKIKKDLSKYSYNDQSKLANIDYVSYKDKKIISICVTVNSGIVEGKNKTSYFIYNISAKTGKLMKPSALVRARGKSDASFFNTVRTLYRAYDKSISVGWKVERGLNRTNLKRVSYKYITPYISPKGHLCFTGYVMNLGIPENAYFRFDTASKKWYDDSLSFEED